MLESAKVDGANAVCRFLFITLPLLTPLLGIIILYSIVMTIGDFEIIYVLTKGGPMNSTHVFSTLAFQEGLATANISRAAAIVLFIFGTGPIQGFAVTLSVGIVTSMFTAIMGTRAIVNLAVGGRSIKGLSI